MTFAEFEHFVDTHANWFQGVQPLSGEAISTMEHALGHRLPESMRWLLMERGYSSACGIDNLDEAVEATLRCRENCGLPSRFIVLNDWDDAGVVWMDRGVMDEGGESPIYWGGAHNFGRLGTDEPFDPDVDLFATYPDWVQFRLTEAQSENF